MQKSWESISEGTLTAENLDALFDNRIPAIRIKNFASTEEIDGFAAAVNAMEPKWYQVGKPAAYIGINLIQYALQKKKQDYFTAAPTATQEIRQIGSSSFNHVERFIEQVAIATGRYVHVAKEPSGEDYFAGIIRMIAQGSDIHFDFAPSFAHDLILNDINAQLAWNVYIDAPDQGGETCIYNRPWERPEGDAGNYRVFSSEELKDAEKYVFRPAAGDLVVFNSRNPHAVLASASSATHRRIAAGSFVGRLPDGRIILWS